MATRRPDSPTLPTGSAGWRSESPVIKINCGLARLPTFTAADRPGYEGPPPYRGMVTISSGTDATQAACETARLGIPSPRWCELYFQTAYDGRVAPPGAHTMSVFAQYVPYTLADGQLGPAAGRDRRHGHREIARFAPDVADCIVERQVLGPPDVEERIGLTGGHIFQGECLPDQMWDRRFAPGHAPPRPLPLRRRHPPRRQRDRRQRPQRRHGRPRHHTASIAARTRAATSAASAADSYFSLGQKNPRSPSFLWRGTTWTWRWATLWEMRLFWPRSCRRRRSPPPWPPPPGGRPRTRHQQRVGQLRQRHDVLTGDDQGVALEYRPMVEEGHHVGIGIDDGLRADLAGGDGAEPAVAQPTRSGTEPAGA